MRTATNMAWPDDPYGTGQLWRKEPRLLAGFAVASLTDGPQVYPVSYAATYLRLHRTQAVDLTPGINFGFRAVSIDTNAELSPLLQVFDMDVMRARRLAKIVAGWRLAEDLAVMRTHSVQQVGRGIQGLVESWSDRGHSNLALAQMCDVAYDQPVAAADLATVAISYGIDISAVREVCEPPDRLSMSLAAWSTIRALICALIAGRALSRFTWQGSLDIGVAVAANAGDCLTSPDLANRTQ
jgi:hypothetical protein